MAGVVAIILLQAKERGDNPASHAIISLGSSKILMPG